MGEGRFRSRIEAVLREETAPGRAPDNGVAPRTGSRLEEVPLTSVRDPDWRPYEDPEDPGYRALKSSVRASGILVPLLLRPIDGGYQVVSGGRRLRAARETGQGVVPALIRDVTDLEAIIGGWDAVLRAGVTEIERQALIDRCAAAGMPQADAQALLASVPARQLQPVEGEIPEGAVEPVVVAPDLAGAEPAPLPESPDRLVPGIPEEPRTLAGWPASEHPDAWIAPANPPPPLPIDPSPFPLDPLPPIDREPPATPAEPPAVPVSAEPPAVAASAEPPADPAPVRPSTRATSPRVITIPLPGEERAAAVPPRDSDDPAVPSSTVTAPGQEATVASAVTPTVIGPRRSPDEVAPGAQEPVPAFPIPQGSGDRTGPRPAMTDASTLATLGVAVGVGAAAFLVVAVLLGAGAGGPLITAAVVALCGFLVALVSLAMPRRAP